MKGSLILLVEDNPLTRKLVRVTLDREGLKLLEATSAASALALLDQHRPELILQDLILPDLSGFDLVQKLRAHPSCMGVPILAFTGLLSKADEGRVTAAGFDGLITKPIEPSSLLHLVRGHLHSRKAPRDPFGGGKQLLVVDDDPLQLKLARFRLARLGFQVETASNGVEAIEAARRSRPDVIVTDALMPRLDGFGLCLAVRKDPEIADVPIVLVTSSYLEPADKELAQRAGANAFVVRTADLGDVIRVLERLFGGGPSPSPPIGHSESLGEMESARALRTLHQLERQVAANSGLMQRCSTLAAELSVLNTVADALVNARDVESALAEILSNCLDVAGASRGAIYVRGQDGVLVVRAQHGFGEGAFPLANLFEDPELVRRVGEAGAPVELASITSDKEALRPSLGLGELIVPLTGRGELLGALLLDVPERGAASEDWLAFAQAIGNQVSLAITLARAFARVEASEYRARALMESAEDAIFVASEDGVLLEVNHAGERLLGLPSAKIVGRRYHDIIPDSDKATTDGFYQDLLHGKPVRGAGGHMLRADGTRVPIEYTAAAVNAGGERMIMTIVRDVSERNAMAEQLRQSQKMEAIGRLAGGVAHDFNNMLSVVLGYSNLLLHDIGADDPMAADLMEPRVLLLNDIVLSMEKMLRRLIGEDVELAVALAPLLGKVRADTGQIHQIILNLVVNARDAMPRGGKVSIETKNLDVDADAARLYPGLPPGRYVTLTVADSGEGIDKNTLARIFEPFFTTKEAGKGTGLGLSTVFGIVQQSGGLIQVDSEPGKGASFRVYLPRTDAAVEERAAPGSPVQGTRGSGRSSSWRTRRRSAR